MLFRVWESINSYMYDERMLYFLSRLAEMHVDPEVSNPLRIADIPDDEISGDEERPKWSEDSFPGPRIWQGLFKDVGMFTEHEWNFLMCKCLASMGKRHFRLLFDLMNAKHHLLHRNSISGWGIFDYRSFSG